MNRMMKKIWKLPLIAWLLIMLFVGIAVGAVIYTLTIPGTITILPSPSGVYEIKAYSDADGTQELTFVDLGTAHSGENAMPLSFYVKNTGNVTTNVQIAIFINGIQGYSGYRLEDLEPEEIRFFSTGLSINIPPEAAAGTYTVTVKLECYA